MLELEALDGDLALLELDAALAEWLRRPVTWKHLDRVVRHTTPEQIVDSDMGRQWAGKFIATLQRALVLESGVRERVRMKRKAA
jgi:hypothetical protein